MTWKRSIICPIAQSSVSSPKDVLGTWAIQGIQLTVHAWVTVIWFIRLLKSVLDELSACLGADKGCPLKAMPSDLQDSEAVDDVITMWAELTPDRKCLSLTGRASRIRTAILVFTDPRCWNLGFQLSFIAGLLCVRHHEKHWRRQAKIHFLCWRILQLKTTEGIPGKKPTQGRNVLGFLSLLQPECLTPTSSPFLWEAIWNTT